MSVHHFQLSLTKCISIHNIIANLLLLLYLPIDTLLLLYNNIMDKTNMSAHIYPTEVIECGTISNPSQTINVIILFIHLIMSQLALLNDYAD